MQLSHAYTGLGLCNTHLCNFDAAEAAYLTALRLADAIGDDSRVSLIASNLCVALTHRGRVAEAIAYGVEGVRRGKRSLNQPHLAASYINLAEACVLAGQMAVASDCLKEAHGWMHAKRTWWTHLEWLLGSTCFALVSGNTSLALSFIEQAEMSAAERFRAVPNPGQFQAYRVLRAFHTGGGERALAVAKQAVETGSWPLMEAVDGKIIHTYVPKRRPVEDYLRLQHRFRLMSLAVAVQMDPIHAINIDADSTFVLMTEAQSRGHGLWYYTPKTLSLSGVASWAQWSQYEDRHGEAPGGDYAWSDTPSFALGARWASGKHRAWLDTAYQPSPVPPQTGPSNYVDSDRVGVALGGDRTMQLWGATLRIGVDALGHRIFRRHVDKDPESIRDEVPDDSIDVLGQQLDAFLDVAPRGRSAHIEPGCQCLEGLVLGQIRQYQQRLILARQLPPGRGDLGPVALDQLTQILQLFVAHARQRGRIRQHEAP